MAGLLPWLLLFFLLFFCGIFLLFFFSARNQAQALYSILQQQKVIRLEVSRLAARLDNLLSDRVLTDEAAGLPAEIANDAPAASPESLIPGLDRLLLEPRAPGHNASASPQRTNGLPDLKL